MKSKAINTGHVALLLPELRIGGAQKVFLTLAKAFVARGLQVDLVLFMADGELLVDIPEGVRLVELGRSPLSMGCISLARNLLSLIKYLRRNSPNVLFSTLTGTNILAIIGSTLSQVSCHVVVREASPLVNLRYSVLPVIMRFLYRKAHYVIVPSDRIKGELLTKLHLPKEKVVKIGNPLDIGKIAGEAKKNLPEDFDQSQPFILSVGRLAPPKDFKTILKAFARLGKNRHMRLVIVGEGPDRPRLEELARNLSIEKFVEFRGFDANPYRWMSRAAVFVLSSHWEGCPNVVIEAKFLGTPVIISRYDNSADEYGEGENRLFPVGDTEALAKLLQGVGKMRGGQSGASSCDFAKEYLDVLGYSL